MTVEFLLLNERPCLLLAIGKTLFMFAGDSQIQENTVLKKKI